ncbi:MAG TPA: hypothetical protein VGI34_05830 [Candidatus Acidoferrales bacterium]|jgi:hypothetical protein
MFKRSAIRRATADAGNGMHPSAGPKVARTAAGSLEFLFFGFQPAQIFSWYSYGVPSNEKHSGKLRASIEVGFIIFLFYSNLMMGEFTRVNGRGKTLVFAFEDIFTLPNFTIAVVSGLIGYVVVEFLRKQI